MSIYLANKEHLDTGLTLVGDAIRSKSGHSNLMEFPNEFVSRINSINTGNIIFDSRIFDYNVGYTPLNLTIEHYKNAYYADVTVEYGVDKLPIFSAISFFTCKQPPSSTYGMAGFVRPNYSDSYGWGCAVAENSDIPYWTGKAPTITILSSSTRTLKLRLSGMSYPASSAKKVTKTLTSAYDNSYVFIVGK